MSLDIEAIAREYLHHQFAKSWRARVLAWFGWEPYGEDDVAQLVLMLGAVFEAGRE
ncbi:MAG TPA: hypothetical protein VGK73_31625 [Polyangiaceae bacterium]